MPFWRKYVPAAQRRAKALRQVDKLRKQGKDIQSVEIEGRAIARSFWGKGWCDHLESFSDYENRLPRGRAYVRNGSVCHLEIRPGRVEAMVSGSTLYNVSISITKLKAAAWKTIKETCSGQIGSMLELLQGKFSDQVMAVVTDRKDGLFPKPDEIELSCSCPDWAVMCKHVAAVMYGVGNRLDSQPELLFVLRDVDAAELIAAEIALPRGVASAAEKDIADEQLSAIFGIELDMEAAPDPAQAPAEQPKRRPRGKATGKATPKKKKSRTAASGAKKAARPGNSARGAGSSRAAAKDVPAARPGPQPTGKSVARLRNQLGLSVAQFAAKLGVTAASVYRWETTQGRLKLQARTLNALAALRQQAKTKVR